MNDNYQLAFVFPGQGSQALGMMSGLAENFSIVKCTFDQASEVLQLDLWELVQSGPLEELNQTVNTQPAMLCAGVAMWRVWCEQTDVRPGWMAGHSLGEYSALVCSGAIKFEDAINLVACRGKLMQEAVPAGIGAMAAIIGLEDHEVVAVCNESAQGEIVEAVNFNAPGQVVIAGHLSAINRSMALAKERGAKRALPLPVSVPSHCALMKPAAEKLAEYLTKIEINSPSTTVIHNVDVGSHNASEVICNALQEQLYKPVRWVDTIKFMFEQGVSEFVECGPGKVLVGLNKRIVKEAAHSFMYDLESLNKVKEQMNG